MGSDDYRIGFEIGSDIGSAIQRGAAEWKKIQLEKQQRSEFQGLMGLYAERRASRPPPSQDRQVLGGLVARAERYRDRGTKTVPTGGALPDGSPETETVIDTAEGPISLQQVEVLRRRVQQEEVNNMMADLDLLMEIQTRGQQNPLVQQWAASTFLGIKQKQDIWYKSLEAQRVETDRFQAEIEGERAQLEREKFAAQPARERAAKTFETDEGIRRDAAQESAQQQRELTVERERQKGQATKPPTEVQSKAATFGRRVEQALGELESIDYDRTALSAGIRAKLPNVTKPAELQRLEQAERNFLSAVLRKESGALITENELKFAEKQYFPRAGDKPEVVEQKNRNRLLAMEALRGEAGSAWGMVPPGETGIQRGSPPGTRKGAGAAPPDIEDLIQKYAGP